MSAETLDTAVDSQSPTPRPRKFQNRKLLLTLMTALVAAFFALPVIWITASAFTPRSIIFDSLNNPSLRMLLPSQPTFDNFLELGKFDFWLYLGNSVIVAGVSVVLGLILTSLAAFALATLDFRGRGVIFAVIVILFMIPFDAIAVPLSVMFYEWDLANTYTALILPGLAHGMAVFSLRQFFLNVPRSMVEAAALDGAGPLRVLWKIYIPLSKPAVITAATLLFIGQWVAYLWPLLVGTENSKILAPIALAGIFAEYNIDYGRLFAGALLLGVIPGLLLLMVQKHFTTSIASEADKG